jgi:hypothetical protein
MQHEVPVGNTPDQHRFDDWTGQLMADLAEPLPTFDDRCRFYESVIRAGVALMYRDHGFDNTREFVSAMAAAIEGQWQEDCTKKRVPKGG